MKASLAVDENKSFIRCFIDGKEVSDETARKIIVNSAVKLAVNKLIKLSAREPGGFQDDQFVSI